METGWTQVHQSILGNSAMSHSQFIKFQEIFQGCVRDNAYLVGMTDAHRWPLSAANGIRTFFGSSDMKLPHAKPNSRKATKHDEAMACYDMSKCDGIGRLK